jgi:hypothetical protein
MQEEREGARVEQAGATIAVGMASPVSASAQARREHDHYAVRNSSHSFCSSLVVYSVFWPVFQEKSLCGVLLGGRLHLGPGVTSGVLPVPAFLLRREPALLSFLGHIPAQDARCPAAGKRLSATSHFGQHIFGDPLLHSCTGIDAAD